MCEIHNLLSPTPAPLRTRLGDIADIDNAFLQSSKFKFSSESKFTLRSKSPQPAFYFKLLLLKNSTSKDKVALDLSPSRASDAQFLERLADEGMQKITRKIERKVFVRTWRGMVVAIVGPSSDYFPPYASEPPHILMWQSCLRTLPCSIQSTPLLNCEFELECHYELPRQR